MAENSDIYDLHTSDQDHDVHEYAHGADDADTYDVPATPPPEPQKPAGNQKMAMIAAGIVGTLALFGAGSAIYSKLNKPSAGDIPSFTPVPGVSMPQPITEAPHAPAMPVTPTTEQIAADHQVTPQTTNTAAPPPNERYGTHETPAPTPMPMPVTAAAGASSEAASAQLLAQVEQRLKELEDRLNTRVADLESRLKMATDKLSRAPVTTEARAHKESHPTKAPVTKPVSDAKPDATAAVTAPDYLRVQATIVGQAWINNLKTGRVTVVREGETLIDGIKILKIDAEKHVVRTNRGDLISE